MSFKRDIIVQLHSWQKSKNRKPLIIRGARQVGKTSVLKSFGALNFKQTAYFNFDENTDLKQLFETTKDPETIIKNLSILNGLPIIAENTLIIFDEIQESHNALNALKYFAEKAPEYFIACAGSLLGILLGKRAAFPVGKVDFLNMYPLTFKEFLNENSLVGYLLEIDKIEPIPDIFFNQLQQKFKSYFITGGMPEAAKHFVFDNNIEEAEKSMKAILTAYELDFAKHAERKDVSKINFVWKSVPSQLAKENKKFLYQAVKTGARAREYEDAVNWLKMAGLIHKVNLCSKPGLPLSAYEDLSAFKIYMLDVGLLRIMSNLHNSVFAEGDRMFTEFKGALSENYILQSLVPQIESEPYYWTSEGKAEVDLIFQFENEIIPIEIKAGQNVNSKSFNVYQNSYKPKLRVRYSLKNLSLDRNILNIPLFMADFSNTLIKQALIRIFS